MNVTFRVDASLIMGSGHMIRCLTLAMHLRELGADCCFVCGDNPGNMAGRIRELGFELNLLKAHEHANQRMSDEPNSEPPHANWLSVDWRSDANQTISAIGGRRVDWLIVDHYGIDHKWESLLRRHCDRLMVIDDLADRQRSPS